MKIPHYSPLEHGPEAINIRGMDRSSHVLAFAMLHGLVRIAAFFQQAISSVLISGNERHIIGYSLSDKGIESGGIGVLDDLGDDIPFTRNCADHSNFTSSTNAAFHPFGAVPVLVLAAHKSFVHLDFAIEGRNVTIHGRSPAVAHIPSGPVIRSRILSEDDTVHLQSTHAFFCNQHQVANLKPDFERNLGVLKYGAGHDRETVAIPSTTVMVSAQPMKWAGTHQAIDFLFAVASRALHTFRPTHLNQVLLAGIFTVELGIKCDDGFHDLSPLRLRYGGSMPEKSARVNTNIIAYVKTRFL